MIRRAADHAAGQFRPSFDGLAAPDQVAIGLGKLPGQIDAVAAGRRLERHLFEVFRRGLIIVQAGGGADDAAKAIVGRDINDFSPIDIDGAVVAQT
jgi:hypothetical protein